MTDKLDALVAQAIYEADSDGGYDPDDPRTFWMAEDGYWPPSEKMVVWDAWLRVADAAIAAMDQAQAAEIERLKLLVNNAVLEGADADWRATDAEKEIERLRAEVSAGTWKARALAAEKRVKALEHINKTVAADHVDIHQKYVDANMARIDAEKERDEWHIAYDRACKRGDVIHNAAIETCKQACFDADGSTHPTDLGYSLERLKR